MEVIALQSGSNGNCFYVELGGTRLLFDAGISGRTAQQRLRQHGRDIRDVDALFISHDHNDHTRCMGVFQRMFGLPVYATRKTVAAAQQACPLGRLDDVRYFTAGRTVDVGDVQVHTVPTPHDGADGVAFVVEYQGTRLGILTDLGHVFDGLRDVLLSLDAAVIESNYDPQMLARGPYPERLKRRIRGPGGHLSNDEAADLVSRTACFKRLQWACLCHLSAENNSPDVALRTHRAQVGREFPLFVASRYQVSEVMRVKRQHSVAG
jgi:phosphoribosyl 1,2-cyclic phosphodiesterase